MIPLRLYLYAAAVLAIVGALAGYGHHQKAKGRAEVQAKWDAHQARQAAAQAEADRKQAAEDISRFRNVERSRENDARIQQVRAVADAAAMSELDRLRRAIAAHRPAPQTGDPQAIARADEAAEAARELLGECASRYQAVAREAGELAGQVVGWQGYAQAIHPGAGD